MRAGGGCDERRVGTNGGQGEVFVHGQPERDAPLEGGLAPLGSTSLAYRTGEGLDRGRDSTASSSDGQGQGKRVERPRRSAGFAVPSPPSPFTLPHLKPHASDVPTWQRA